MNWLRIGFLVVACGSWTVACGGDDGGGSNGTGGTGTGGMGTGGMGTGGMGTGGTGTGGTGGMGGMAGSTAGMPTFDAVYNEIIVGTGCNGGPTCHASIAGGGLEMPDKATAYAQLVNIPAMGRNLPPNPAIADCVTGGKIRVVPGDPAASLLVEKVKPMPSCGVRMPVAGMITDAQIMQIEMWIAMGAMNN